MTLITNHLGRPKSGQAPPPGAQAGDATLWDLFQTLQDLTDDEDLVLIAVEDLFSRGLLRWASAGRPNAAATLH